MGALWRAVADPERCAVVGIRAGEEEAFADDSKLASLDRQVLIGIQRLCAGRGAIAGYDAPARFRESEQDKQVTGGCYQVGGHTVSRVALRVYIAGPRV